MENSRIDTLNFFTPLQKKEEKSTINFTPLVKKKEEKSTINFKPLEKKKEEKSAADSGASKKEKKIGIARILGPVKMCEKNNERDVEILRRIAASCLNYVEDPGLEKYNFDRSYVDVQLNNTLKEALGTPDSPVKIYPGDSSNRHLDELAMKNAVYVWEAEENACEKCRNRDGEIFETKPFHLHPNCRCRFTLLLPPPGGQREGMLFEEIYGRYFLLPQHLYETQNPNLKENEGRIFRQLNPMAEEQLLDYMVRTMLNPQIRNDFKSVIKHWVDVGGFSRFYKYVRDNGKYDGRPDVRKIIAGRYRVIDKKGKLVPVTNYRDETGPAFVFPLEGKQALVDYDIIWNFLFGYFAHRAGVPRSLGLAGSTINDMGKLRGLGLEDYPAVKAGYKMAEKGYPISKEVIRHLLTGRPVNQHE